MKIRNLYLVLSLLTLVSMLLTACGGNSAQPTSGGDTSKALCTYNVQGTEYVIKFGTTRFFAVDEDTVIAVPCPGTYLAVEHDASVLQKIDADVDVIGIGVCKSKVEGDTLHLKLTFANHQCAWLKGGQ